MTRHSAATVFYEDQRFTVTAADIRTRLAYYPVADTVGRIRRDPLWWALAHAGLTGLALVLYRDLWRPEETTFLGASIVGALLVGSRLAVLQLDARGFPSRLFVARARTVREVFNAITEARALGSGTEGSAGQIGPGEPNNEGVM